MDRLEKKCLIGSVGTHLFLLTLMVLGSAFFVPSPKLPPKLESITVLPDIFSDDPHAKGGGDPKLAKTDERPKGDSLKQVKPPDPAPEVVKPPTPKPPTPKPPTPVVKTTPKPPKIETPKVDNKKPSVEPKPPKPSVADLLKPAVRTEKDRKKQQQEAEKAAQAEAARKDAAERKSLLTALNKGADSIKRGFKDGTRLTVGGEGGKARGNYAAFVREAFDNEWEVSPSLTADEGVAVVEVTIARDGRIIRKRIVEYSKIRMLDDSVQRAIDRVISLPEFPADSTDDTRIYELEFNLKTKRRLG